MTLIPLVADVLHRHRPRHYRVSAQPNIDDPVIGGNYDGTSSVRFVSARTRARNH